MTSAVHICIHVGISSTLRAGMRSGAPRIERSLVTEGALTPNEDKNLSRVNTVEA